MLTGNLEMQLWLGLLQHTFSLSDGISLQFEQMHQLGTVTVVWWGFGFSPWIVWRMSSINKGCLEHTNFKASLRPKVSSDEMQFWNWIHIHMKKYKIEILKNISSIIYYFCLLLPVPSYELLFPLLLLLPIPHGSVLGQLFLFYPSLSRRHGDLYS